MTYEIMPSEGIARIESRVNEIFTMAKICHWHSSKLNEECQKRIIDPLNHKTQSGKRRHSVWLAGYFAGYIAAKRSELWNEVEFCYMVKGELYSTHRDSNRKTTEEFYQTGRGHILVDSPGAHYWKGSDKKFTG